METVRPQVIFFDIGQTLVTGAEQSARRLLASRLRLNEKETKVVGRLIMTYHITEPGQLAGALKKMLPDKEPYWLHDVVDTVWSDQITCIREIAGATSLLASLKAMGVKLGLISNIWHPFYQGFCQSYPEMAELFDYAFLSYKVGEKKPSLDLYRKAVQAAGRPASECWMVGDTYELDMEPARKVGMKTLWILCRPERERALLAQALRGEKPAPHWVVEELGEVLPYFQSICGE
jgi:FMN phosphatase YigB (HAD superfamily)